MPYSTANDERSEPFLRHTIICGIYHSRLGDIITRFAQHRAGTVRLYTSVNGEKPIYVFNEKHFRAEMQNHVNVAEQEIAQSRMVESRAFEVLPQLVETLIRRHTERLTRRPAVENAFETAFDSQLFEFKYDFLWL